MTKTLTDHEAADVVRKAIRKHLRMPRLKGGEWMPIIATWVLWVGVPCLAIGYAAGACHGLLVMRAMQVHAD